MRSMSFKKTVKAAARVVLTNVCLARGKLLYGDRLRYSPVICLVLSNEVEISRNGTIDSKGLCIRGRCRFNVQESGSILFGEGMLLPDAKPSPIAVAISELMGDPALRARLVMGTVTSVRRFGLAEALAATSIIDGIARC